MKILDNNFGDRSFFITFENGWSVSVLEKEQSIMATDQNNRELKFKDVDCPMGDFENNVRYYKTSEDILKFLNMVANFHDTLVSYTILFSSDKEG